LRMFLQAHACSNVDTDRNGLTNEDNSLKEKVYYALIDELHRGEEWRDVS
jgi:hypothetical protein